LKNETTFKWKESSEIGGHPNLLEQGVRAALIVPAGWGASLKNGDPMPLPLYLDGADTNAADELQGRIKESLAKFQKKQLEDMVTNLPDQVIEMAKELPVDVRKQFVSAMSQWGLKSHVLYNPDERFIEYVVPGIIGIILQLLTVTLTACTIARERESGTLYQLMVTSLRRSEIVMGKILPYLGISILLILVVLLVAGWHFDVAFHQPPVLALICLLFLLCSLGLGLLISAFSRTQTQAIQFSVFFLLPIFVLSGAFAPLEQLPQAIRYISEIFPLTHFCRAFRLVNLYRAGPSFYAGDLIFMFVGAVATFVGAAFLLRRIQK
jgi:ABC-2 type transport system permease protein